MQKFNDISKFISELEYLAHEYSENGEPILNSIQSSTSIPERGTTIDISPDEWESISDIVDESYKMPDIHKQSEYLHDSLEDLGYSDDEILHIVDFAEVNR